MLLLPWLGACDGPQSALQPTGPAARDAALLTWWMSAAWTLVFLLVLALLLYAALRNPERRRQISPTALIVAGGVVLPVVALSILLPFSVRMGLSSSAPTGPEAVSIAVEGNQWWWDIDYFPAHPERSFTAANEIYIPAGEPVELLLTSADVIHSLWIPRLAGKQDLIPGHRNRLVIEADRPGVFRAQCAEFCGIAHAGMALYVVAVPREEFDAWAEGQRATARNPATELQTEGAAAFMSNGCALCHTVRGHRAWGREAPDLTHVGGRKTIGGGLMPNTAENIALWIAQNHELKPGNRMPSFTGLDRDTRIALGAYLENLK